MPPRLAWFTPLPPTRSGISAYSAELLPLLADSYAIDVFVEEVTPEQAALAAVHVLDAHHFIPRQSQAPYDLIVYQLGNAACHDYMWPYLVRYPGLVVLHDAALHHSRARALLADGRTEDYRAELRYAYPDVDPRLPEFAIAGLEGSPYYLWPLNRVALTAARAVAVHSPWLAERLREELPGLHVTHVRMGVRPVEARARPEAGGPWFACFGLMTPEKRLHEVLTAFSHLRATAPDARLLLVGETTDHYDLAADVARLGLTSQVTLTGFVPDRDLDDWLMRADVCLCLRWPTARETSASWLRCLAAGRPTVVTDLAHLEEVPMLDPRTWELTRPMKEPFAGAGRPTPRDAVAVAVDILDEGRSLWLAMERLATDARLRERLGRNAQAWWGRHHTLERMAEDYRAAVADALACPEPEPPADWPAHLRDSADGLLRRIAGEFDLQLDV